MAAIGEFALKDAGMWDLEWEARKESLREDRHSIEDAIWDDGLYSKDAAPKQQEAGQNSGTLTAEKAGYVQGVCECAAAIGGGSELGKKLLSEMNVSREAAKKYAKPETYAELEKTIFAPKREPMPKRVHGRGL